MTDCIRCIHFNVCSRLVGGMDLVECEDFDAKPRVGKMVLKANWAGQLEWECTVCNKRTFAYPCNHCPDCGAMIVEEVRD